MTLTQEEERELSNLLNEKSCFLCDGALTEETEFKCGLCGSIFWKGYLCRRAIESARNMGRRFLQKYFPGVHNCLN